MAERTVPGLTIDKIRRTAVKPREVTQAQWITGMTVTSTLMEMGTPINVIEKSHCGPDFPNKYQVNDVRVEHMPQWSYAIVDNGEKRRHVQFRVPKELSSEDVAVNLKTAIADAQPKGSAK